MTWVRFEEDAADHPKIVGLTDAEHRLWFNAICYANKQLTDGYIPGAIVPRLMPHKPAAVAVGLVKAGLWIREGEGYRIHDYHDYQPRRIDVLNTRAERAAAGARGGAKTQAKRKQTASKRPSKTQANGQANFNPVPVPVPVPVDPDPKITPLTPRKRGERLARARAGSRRRRDLEALPEIERAIGPKAAAAMAAYAARAK